MLEEAIEEHELLVGKLLHVLVLSCAKIILLSQQIVEQMQMCLSNLLPRILGLPRFLSRRQVPFMVPRVEVVMAFVGG